MTTSPPSASDGTRDRGTSQAFARLDPRLQRWIYERGWTSLHDAQERAVAPILAGNRDVIIVAATAAGKTEAAFLPICSAIAGTGDGGGLAVLYVSPLKALINDQHDRLELLCERADVAVHRWHGDVAGSAKQRLLRAPSGVLIITPESLEALFVNRGPQVPGLLAGLRYVVVDELHAFLATARGAQLQSLLQRVELAVRRRPPRIGLSATLGDLGAAAEFLRPGRGPQVECISSTADGQEVRLQVRGYRKAPPTAPDHDDPSPEETADQTEDRAIADHLFAALRGADNLVFANTRRHVEIYADLLRRRCEAERVPNEFWPHHGNLAKEVREVVETALKDRTRPATAVCTSTLEMGVDIGSVSSVVQVGPPPSVASLRQRLGRSGRRGEPAVLRVYVAEDDVDVRSSPIAQLRTDLVQTVAMVRLLLRRWVEAPVDPGFNLSTLVQQTLSLIAQHGGVSPFDAHRALCGHGPFQRVDQNRFVRLLRSMAKADLIVQAGDGALLHGEVGERLVNHYSFYTAFQTADEWRLVVADGGRLLGSMPLSRPITEDDRLIFAGRRWTITRVDAATRTLELRPASGGVPPDFGGGGAPVADEVRREMAAVYGDTEEPPWLDQTARALLAEARQAWQRFGLDGTTVLAWGADTIVLPWVGDRALVTAGVALKTAGVAANAEGPGLLAHGGTPAQVVDAARRLVAGQPPPGADLAQGLQNLVIDKWDWVLDDDLATEAASVRQLDVTGAWAALHRVAKAPVGRPGAVASEREEPSAPPAPAPAAAPGRARRAAADFCVVGVETTGFSPRLGDRILEVATVRMRSDGTVTDEWSTLVNPRRDVGARHVHGITATDLVGAPVFPDIAGDLLEQFDGAVVAAHNLRFDWQFLAAEYERAGHALPPLPRLCTLGLGTRLGPSGTSRRLAACCEAFGIPVPRAHQALDDARAAACLLAVYIERARRRGRDSLEDLGCEPLTWPAALPALAPSGRRHDRGERRHLDAQAGYLARLVTRLDAGGDLPPHVAAYADLLDRALEDRRLSPRESEALFATATDWQLDASTVAQVHRDYLAALVTAARADGVVSEAEHTDLVLVARLLGLPDGSVNEALAERTDGDRPTAGSVPDTATRLAPGTTVCFTGALTGTIDGTVITRALAEDLATRAGLVVVQNVSRKLDVLVVADPDTLSGKAKRARELGTRLMAECVFWRAVDVDVG